MRHRPTNKQYLISLTLLSVIYSNWLLAAEDIDLFSMDLAALLKVKVSIANRSEQKLSEASAVVSVITRNEIEKRGWVRLEQVLEHIPGFMMRKQVAGANGLVVRGLHSSDGILLMADGVALNDPMDGNFSFYDISLKGVEQIEVIRGPGSALYGGYALLSTINLVTQNYDPTSTDGSLDLALGENQSKLISADYQYQHNYFAGKAWFNASNINDDNKTINRDAVNDLIIRNDARDRYAAIANDTNRRDQETSNLSLGYQLQINQGYFKNATISGLHLYRLDKPRLSRLFALTEQGQLERRDDLHKFNFKWDKSVGESINLSTNLYYRYLYNRQSGQITRPYERNDDEDFDGITERWPTGKIEIRAYDIDVYGGEIASSFKIGRSHQMRAGLVSEISAVKDTVYYANTTSAINGSPLSINIGEVVNLQENDPKNNGPTYWIVPNVERQLNGFYLQDEWQLATAVSATLGYRYDHYDDSGSAASPRVSFVWQKSEQLFFKGIYAEAFKPPSFIALYDQTVTDENESRRFGNPALESSTIKSAELLMGYRPQQNILWQASLFSAETNNEVIFDNNQQQYTNEGRRKTKGIEVELNGNWSSWTLWSNYSFNQPSGGTGSGAILYPQHQLNIGANWKINDDYDLAVNYSYRSEFQREASDQRKALKQQNLLDASFNYKINSSMSLRLTGSNLLNENVYSPVDVNRSSQLPGDIPQAGRLLMVQLSINF